MLKRIHIPNLFILIGEPDNGKTTCSNHFQKLLDCEVIHTDQVYQMWIEHNHPQHYKAAKRNIRGHYPSLSPEIKRAWNEYVTSYILRSLRLTKLNLVAEGWLLQFIPEDLQQQLSLYSNKLIAKMKTFQAHSEDKILRSKGKDYTAVVHGLISLLSQTKATYLMRNKVKYQCFEDLRDFQGTSDSCGKLLSLNLPTDMTDKTVLDIGCNTGYFAIRCAQRGAKAIGLDTSKSSVVTAARLAYSVYRKPEIKFYHCDIFNWDKPKKFDYVLAINLLPSIKNYNLFFDKALSLLNYNGTLVLSLPILRNEPSDDRYVTENKLRELTRSFKLIKRNRSVITSDKTKKHMVYHFESNILVENYVI